VLFTPGGDVVYAIDEHKQNRWHLQLCAVLQELLGLAEPPHFLVPCFTATIDCWVDAQRQTRGQAAELYPMVQRYQALLNVLFHTKDLQWSVLPNPGATCDPAVLMTYRSRFPELWQCHDLVIKLDDSLKLERSPQPELWGSNGAPLPPQGYVFRLFVSGQSLVTEQVLHNLHQVLERSLQRPYTLKIVDVKKHPELAELNQITATPTLVRIWPRPVRRIVGDLNSVGKILQDLTSSF
jgi:circadian clock protein KaiB